MSPNTTGALMMMASMAAFTFNDALIKMTDGAVPLMQMLFLRGLLATTVIYALACRLGALRLDVSRADWGVIGIRSMADAAAAFFFVTALLNLPLANVTAILQVLPLTVAIGAALVFREPLGWKRMSAILLGFMGMLLIVRPGPEGFNLWTGYALLAVICVTVRDLATRRLSAQVPSMMVTFVGAAVITLCAGLFSTTEEWVPITPRLGLLIGGAALCIIGAYFFSVQVMRVGDISFVAPFRYTGLIWALLLGWLVFGDWPTGLTLIGACVVVGTGLFTLYRERRVKRARTRPAPR